MGSTWKIAVPIVLVGLITGVFFYSQLGTNPATEKSVTKTEPAPVASVSQKPTTSFKDPAATGNIDDVVNALLSDATLDQATFNAESGDAAEVGSDSQALNDVNQTYDPNQF
ncbi:MAG TPA: hypothetical protein VJK04_01810 [Candidatus Paceibacterota bacterium]